MDHSDRHYVEATGNLVSVVWKVNLNNISKIVSQQMHNEQQKQRFSKMIIYRHKTRNPTISAILMEKKICVVLLYASGCNI